MAEIKLCVVGPAGVGKSALCRALAEQPQLTHAPPGAAAAPAVRVQELRRDVGGQAALVQLWDVAGAHCSQAFWEVLATGADGVLLVTDPSQPEQERELEQLYLSFAQRNALPMKCVLVLALELGSSARGADWAGLSGKLRQLPAAQASLDPGAPGAARQVVAAALDKLLAGTAPRRRAPDRAPGPGTCGAPRAPAPGPHPTGRGGAMEAAEPLLGPAPRAAGKGDPPSPWRAVARRGGAAAGIIAGAALLAWRLPTNKGLPCPWCQVSSAIGWLYFLCWSVSFHPQVWTNYRRRSVEGLSLDFIAMNVVGFLCYSLFNLGLVLSPTVQAEYRERFGETIPVELNDVVFGLHALLMSLVMAWQCAFYKRGPAQRVSAPTALALAASGVAGAGYAARLLVMGESGDAPWTWLDFCYFCSLIKMAVTLVKYIPQVHLNRTRRSTEGWSIDNVTLDLAGGLLSTGQLLVSCRVLNDWSAVAGNPIKFGLGLTSFVFDVAFILQHARYGSRAAAALPRHHVVAAAAHDGDADGAGATVTVVLLPKPGDGGWLAEHEHSQRPAQ
ncbi:cystinosin [Scenedesmus sp. PABB004]|nr:cystinosin [Scenedesmus sp. PABB004]